ncbi:MAG: YicC/YloC family endoribonuclease [Betaproteobacteria bacterium]
MIYSMTGYASVSRDLPLGTVSLELRSVNHRYLDIQFRVPEEFRPFEPAMREALGAKLTRGKLECRVGLARAPAAPALLEINEPLLVKLTELNAHVKSRMPMAADLDVNDVLRWPGMFGAETLPLEELREACMSMLSVAMAEFTATRGREGEKLKTMLLERVTSMEALARNIAPKIPLLVAAHQEKLTQRLREVVASLDEERVRQEVALFATRIDVDEELTRLNTHLSEVRRILAKGGNVGKRLDFVMQELNREANTLGSKSVDVEVSQTSMELKVLIEQMREQVQNIE